MAVRKTVTEEEFRQALSNEDIVKTMKAALSKYRGLMPEDDLQSCGLNALWRSLGYYIPGKGNKQTTSLWQFIKWEVCRELKKIFRQKAQKTIPLSTLEVNEILEIPDNKQEQIEQMQSIKDGMDSLSPANKELIQQYYFDRYTMEEIGKMHGYSKEAARQKINRALSELRKVCLSGV